MVSVRNRHFALIAAIYLMLLFVVSCRESSGPAARTTAVQGISSNPETGHGNRFRTGQPRDDLRRETLSPQKNGDFERALELAKQHLNAERYQHAYDAMLAAMRLNASDPALLQTVLHLVENMSSVPDDEAVDLAYDLYIRADGLIPFQPVELLAESRKKHLDTAKFFETSPPPPADPFSGLASQLKAAASNEVPDSVRSNILQRARAELDDLAIQVATGEFAQLPAKFWGRWEDARRELDDAERDLLESMYQKLRHRILIWHNQESDAAVKNAYSAKLEENEKLTKSINELLTEGYRLLRETAPYFAAQIPKAVADQKQGYLRNRIKLLERTREWIYNQRAIHSIQDAEAKSDTPLEQLRSLAEIDENRLAPYVAKRFQEVWGKLFEECTEKEQLAAVKARILGRFEE